MGRQGLGCGVAPEKEVRVRKVRASLSRQTRQSVDAAEPLTGKPGEDTLIDTVGLLTPNDVTLDAWIKSASDYRATLCVVVKLLDKQSGDALSLQSGYDTAKVTSQWNTSTGELSLDVRIGSATADIRKALGFLSLDTDIASSDSARKVWLFPTFSGLSHLRCHVDEAAGLVRYYLYDTTGRSFSSASSTSSGRELFGKSGYLGMCTSNAGKNIYTAL